MKKLSVGGLILVFLLSCENKDVQVNQDVVQKNDFDNLEIVPELSDGHSNTYIMSQNNLFLDKPPGDEGGGTPPQPVTYITTIDPFERWTLEKEFSSYWNQTWYFYNRSLDGVRVLGEDIDTPSAGDTRYLYRRGLYIWNTGAIVPGSTIYSIQGFSTMYTYYNDNGASSPFAHLQLTNFVKTSLKPSFVNGNNTNLDDIFNAMSNSNTSYGNFQNDILTLNSTPGSDFYNDFISRLPDGWMAFGLINPDGNSYRKFISGKLSLQVTWTPPSSYILGQRYPVNGVNGQTISTYEYIPRMNGYDPSVYGYSVASLTYQAINTNEYVAVSVQNSPVKKGIISLALGSCYPNENPPPGYCLPSGRVIWTAVLTRQGYPNITITSTVHMQYDPVQ
ncbi:hypothetical protein L6Q79_06735 [bacterium]|nr:hypothetical protein [bacterium]NUN46861.1 hypothetical protein [bacterium]